MLCSKQSTGYIVKKPLVPLIWAALKLSPPCGTHVAIRSYAAPNITDPLEEVFCCQLQLAIADLRAGHLPEGSVAEIGVGCSVLGCIESIKAFKAHFQALRFRKGHLEA